MRPEIDYIIMGSMSSKAYPKMSYTFFIILSYLFHCAYKINLQYNDYVGQVVGDIQYVYTCYVASRLGFWTTLH